MHEPPRSLRRRSFVGGLCAAGATALAGCSGREGSAVTNVLGGSPATSLRIGTLEPAVTLDPVTAKDVGSSRAIQRVFDGLYTYGTGTDLRPQIAEGSPTRDGPRAVLVHLDEAATFQNGDPVTPADVTYSFEAPVEEDTAVKDEVDAVESVEVVDDRTVRFVLGHPSPTLDRTLTRPIVPEAVREADREGFATDPVGAGPYEVEAFTEEKKLQLTRWSDYWGSPAPEIDRVTVVYVESPVTQLTGLRANRTDVVEPVSPQLEGKVREVADAAVARTESYRSFYFGFNANEGPTTERAVREAVGHCIDLDRVVEEFVGDLGHRQYGPVPPQVAEDWDLPHEEWRSLASGKDIEKARRLFEEAEDTGGQLRILTSKDPKSKEFGQELASGLRDAGQGALVESAAWTEFLERYVSGAERDYAVFVGEIAGTPDPDSFLYPVVHENMQGLTNGIFYNDETVMNELLEARRTTDRDERRELYTSAIRTLLEERVLLPVCSFENSFAYDRRLEGLRAHPIARLNPRLAGPDGVVGVSGE